MENSIDFDILVVEFQKDNKSIGSVSIAKSDLEKLQISSDITLPDIASDMTNSLIQDIQEIQKNEGD